MSQKSKSCENIQIFTGMLGKLAYKLTCYKHHLFGKNAPRIAVDSSDAMEHFERKKKYFQK